MITMISFTACQDDDEIIYNLTDCSWRGHMFDDRYGDPIMSTFTFSEDGYGIERQEFVDGIHTTYSFEWKITRNGEIKIYYPKEDLFVYIHSYYVGEYAFSGEYQIEDDPISTQFNLNAVW